MHYILNRKVWKWWFNVLWEVRKLPFDWHIAIYIQRQGSYTTRFFIIGWL